MATDKERLDAAANWIRNNQDKKGTPDWEAVTGVYKQLRGAELTTPSTEPLKNPFAGQSIEQLNKAYANHKFMGNKDLLPLIADARAKAEMDQGGFPYALGDSVRQAVKGIPIAGGLVDEGIAGATSLLGGNYEDTLEAERARDRARHEANPETALGMNLFGGVAATILAAPALGVGSLGVNATRPPAQTALRGAAIGFPVGAADGFTRGEGGLEGRGESALIGGGLGLLGGAAAPVIGQGLATGYTNVRNALSRMASLRGTGMDPKVAGALAETLQGDDALGQALARIRQGGDDAMLVDAGPNAAGALDATIQMGGPQAVRVASGAVEQRASDAARRMTAEADRTFGQPQGVRAQRQAIRQGAQPALGNEYRAAYAQPIDFATPEGQAIATAWRRVRPEVRAQANVLLDEAGLPPIQDGTPPTVEQIDRVTRALYGIAEGTEGRGVLGGLNDRGRSANALARELRDLTRTAVPEYDQALTSAADAAGRSQAVVLGSRILSPSTTRDQVAEELAGMIVAERQAVRAGIRAQLDDAVATVKQMASEPNQDARELKKLLENVTSQASRQKIGMVLGNPNEVLRFYREVGRAMRALELKAQVATNSRSAGRQAISERMGDAFEPGPAGTALQGEGPKALKQLIQMATGATKNQQRQAMNERWLSLAQALTGPRGRDAEALFRRLIAANRVRGQNALAGQRLGILGAGTVAGGTSTLNSQLRRTRPYPEAPGGYPYTVSNK